jgi:outer membrane protein assembly factor BamE (lipoprotein component of BamABCDE complex)
MVKNGSKGPEIRRPPLSRSGPAAGRLALLLALLALAPGCLIFGRQQTDQPVEWAKVVQVQKGMTKAQVTELLGSPQEILFSNKAHDPLQEHAFIYEYIVQKGTVIFLGIVNFGNLDQKKDRAIVFFDDGERVSNVSSSLHGSDARYGFPFGR